MSRIRSWRAGAGLLREIVRFLRTAGAAETEGKSFDVFLRDEGYSDSFRWHYLVPMTAALWSTAPGDALDARRVCDLTVFHRDIEVDTQQHAFVLEIRLIDRVERAAAEPRGSASEATRSVRFIASTTAPISTQRGSSVVLGGALCSTRPLWTVASPACRWSGGESS